MDLETLERRRLYSVTVVQGYPGFYNVYGTDSADVIAISVSTADSSFTVDGARYDGVAKISVFAYGGDDTVTVNIDGPSNIGASVDAGDGNDDVSIVGAGSIWGGNGNDTLRLTNAYRGEIYGGSGDDRLSIGGESADSLLEGEQGNDLIDARDNNYAVVAGGGAGDDTVFGSNYDDQIYGDAGSDLLIGNNGNDTFYAVDMERDRIVGCAGIDVAYADYGEGGVWGVEYVFYF
jgi:Ca2+-binding RTX toxin-like protein